MAVILADTKVVPRMATGIQAVLWQTGFPANQIQKKLTGVMHNKIHVSANQKYRHLF
jgi:hypothetical protein